MRVFFVTASRWKLEEVRRLLAGVEVVWARRALAKPPGTDDPGAIAEGRLRDAWRQLGAPCFVENTSLELEVPSTTNGAQYKTLLLEQGEAELARRFGGARGRSRVAVAYTENGVEVDRFEGSQGGRLLTEPRGPAGYGWDRLWVPDGFQRTLAELGDSKHLVSLRHVPYLELAARLDSDGPEGIFESHITVKPCDLSAFATACDQLALKCIAIELAQGAEPVQPMTAAHHHGTFGVVLRTVRKLAAELVKKGFTVSRLKIEAVGRNRDIPPTDEAAACAPKSAYFEHHLKLAVPTHCDLVELAAACRAVDAHLSRNARKPVIDGLQERFATIRSWGVGRSTADARFERLVRLVHSRGLEVRDRVREYTVYDSAIQVDRDWMKES